MSKEFRDPEIDLLIIESLDANFRSVNEIAKDVEISPEVVSTILDELSSQGLAIEKKGTSYRVLSEEEEF